MSEEKNSQQETEESEAGKDTFFSDAPAPVIQNPEKKGISKNIRMLIAAVTALIVLGGALTAVLLTNKNSEQDVDSLDVSSLAEGLLDDDEKNAVMLNPESADDLKEIIISNQDDFRVYKNAEKTSEDDAGYTI